MTPSRVPVSTDGELEQVIRSDCDCQTLRKSLDKDDKNEEGKGKWLKSKNAVNEGKDVETFPVLFYISCHLLLGSGGILGQNGDSILRGNLDPSFVTKKISLRIKSPLFSPDQGPYFLRVLDNEPI